MENLFNNRFDYIILDVYLFGLYYIKKYLMT